MTPIPPPDAAIPSVALLLDGEAVGDIVSRYIESPVVTCRPTYVRYKPGTSCLVMYDLVTREGTGEPVGRPMSLKVYGDDRGTRRASNKKMARLIERVGESGIGPSYRPVHFLTELDALMQVFPVDYDLRFLARATSSDAMTRSIRATGPELASAIVAEPPELIRYKPARKALLRYRLTGSAMGEVYGKLRTESDVSILASQTRRLIDAGVSTPPVRIVIPGDKFVAHDAVGSDQLAGMRGTTEFVRWMDPLAEALARLHGVEVTAPNHTNRDEAETVVAAGEALSTLVPAQRSRVEQVTSGIARRLGEIEDRSVTVHGDFYDDQALVSDGAVTIIDLDELRIGHPLLDAGNMLAHLASGAARGEHTAEARGAFAGAFRERAGWSDAELAVFEAAALIKLAPGPFRRLEPGWPERIARIVGLAEARLGDAHVARHIPSAPIVRGGPISDPKLPQLTELQEPGAMTEALNASMAVTSLSVLDIEPVRHKPGRRAILRYRVERDGHWETLYAKTFASKRGPKVHEITRAITAARAFGEEVDLPDPVAYLSEQRTIVQREVSGEAIASALLGEDTGLVERIAQALHGFHHSGLDLGRGHDLRKELEPLPMRLQQVTAVSTVLGERAERLLGRIECAEVARFQWRRLPVHRDFYHDQILVDGDALAVLDLDDAAMSEPAVDVANFAAHLSLLGLQTGGDAGILRHQIEAFVGLYQSLGDPCDPALLRILTATTMLRISGIHVTRERGHEVARGLIEAAERLLC